MTTPYINGDIREIPVSVLAYIGDAVFELEVRLFLCRHQAGQSGKLHRESIKMVSAAAQAASARKILPQLHDDEKAVFLRARNSQSGSMPRNALPADYQLATALEAVIGYLYLKNELERKDELIRLILDGDVK